MNRPEKKEHSKLCPVSEGYTDCCCQMTIPKKKCFDSLDQYTSYKEGYDSCHDAFTEYLKGFFLVPINDVNAISLFDVDKELELAKKYVTIPKYKLTEERISEILKNEEFTMATHAALNRTCHIGHKIESINELLPPNHEMRSKLAKSIIHHLTGKGE